MEFPEDKQTVPKQLQNSFPNIPLSEDEQKVLVQKCNAFKKESERALGKKRDKMRRAFHYINGEFMPGNPGELLPTFGPEGEDRDLKTGRPKLFLPLARQIYKSIYSQLKLTLFPNDEDYFRVRATTKEAAALEDDLTEGLKFRFKEMLVTERLGPYLQNLVWAGNGQAFPYIEDSQYWQWEVIQEEESVPILNEDGTPAIGPDGQPITQVRIARDENGNKRMEYKLAKIDQAPRPTLDVWNPLNFYPDPSTNDPSKSKWVYTCNKKLQTILDSGIYFNKTRLIEDASKQASYNNTLDGGKFGDKPLEGESSSNVFMDIEGNIIEDIYYFPYIKVKSKEFRNVIASVAGGKHVIRFHPNLHPGGMNPVVFTSYFPDPESPEGTGPIEDILEIQRSVNLLLNYKLETMSRIGNRFGVKKGTDTSRFWGVAGGIMELEDPSRDVIPLTGNFSEIAMLQNELGVLKAEAQITAGVQHPFQGSSNIDFDKTATEMQILQENAITVVREAIEHIAVVGIKGILERLMYLEADLHDEPATIRVDNDNGTEFKEVDFRVLRSGDYYIDVVSANPGQSKKAQSDFLTNLVETATRNPEFGVFLKQGGFKIFEKLAIINGIKDFNEFMNDPQEVAQEQLGQGIPVNG